MRTGKLKSATAALVVLMGSMLVPSAAFADPSALFKQLAGSWRGDGDLEFNNGVRERLSCRGYYVLKAEGEGLSIATLCNSPTQKLEIRSRIDTTANGVSGQWEERTYHATGPISGSVNGTSMDLSFSGPIEGKISISVDGEAHSVNVSAPEADIKGVSISLIRG